MQTKSGFNLRLVRAANVRIYHQEEKNRTGNGWRTLF